MPGGLGARGDLRGVYAAPPEALLPQSFFVVLEGGEGSGKTSLLQPLGDALGNLVDTTREPGGTPEGVKLRGLLLASDSSDWEAEAELLLMMAARIQHVTRRLIPTLADRRPVLCDRFLASTIAYQGAGRGLSEDIIRDLHKKLVGDLIPDLTVVLDIDPRLGLTRSKRRLAEQGIDEERFENLDLGFHDRVRASFLAQAAAAPERHLVVDASLPFFDVKTDVIKRVRSWLTKRGTFPLGYPQDWLS